MHKLLPLLLLLSAVLTVGLCAPTVQEVDMRELLAEIEEEVSAQENQNLANIEQKNFFKGLLGTVLRGGNEYVQEKLNRGGGGREKAAGGGWRRLLGTILDSTNEYAQGKLQPSTILLNQLLSLNQAMEQSDNLPELAGEIRDALRGYLRSKLAPNSEEVDTTTRQQNVDEVEVEAYRAPSEARMEQNLQNLFDEVSKSVTRYLAQKLEPEASVEEETEAREEALSALLPLLKPVLTNLVAGLFTGNSGGNQNQPRPSYFRNPFSG